MLFLYFILYTETPGFLSVFRGILYEFLKLCKGFAHASDFIDETQLHRLFSLQYGPCVLHLLSDVEHQLFYLVFCDIRVVADKPCNAVLDLLNIAVALKHTDKVPPDRTGWIIIVALLTINE